MRCSVRRGHAPSTVPHGALGNHIARLKEVLETDARAFNEQIEAANFAAVSVG